jgi:hypothetical protein
MTIFYSGMVNQMMSQQTAMFAGQQQYAQSMGPRAALPPTSMFDVSARQTGMFGEQVAGGMAGMMRGVGAVGMAGMSLAGAFTGVPTDPLSAGMMGASAGMRFGLGGAALGGVAAAAPIYAATAYMGALGQNFLGGMQNQVELNSTLRNNFQFFGGGGPLGRGFSQSQMGQIGASVSGYARSNPFTSSGELNQLISGGAEMGMFAGTTNVQSFTQNFRRMISTLRDIQRELGGSLVEAQDFIRQSQQSGVFNRVDQTRLAGNLRTAESTTGMNRQQLMQLSNLGSQVSMAAGGRGYQGAFGALNTATQLGAAVQGGFISQEMLSEATGGLQGSEAIQAFTMRMMNMTDRFSRTGAGRYMTFAMSNENGTGLDQVALARMRAGDISVSEIRRRAQHNVNSMGRARALNQEGFLRGAQMEEGGVSGQLTHIRQAMGEAGVDPGSERAQHWMRRVHHLSQSEAQLMSTLMRNQGSIALNEDVTRAASGREAAYNREVSEHRSFDAFTRQLEHGLSENLGMTEARDMGRRFATRISSAVERGFNAMMGLAEGQLSRDQQMSLARISLGRGTAADIREAQRGFSGGPGFSGTWNPNSSSLADQLLHGMGMHSRGSVTEQMEARGDRNFGRYGAVTQIDRVMRADLARQGVVTGADRTALEGLMGARQDTLADITQAQMRARGAGHEDNWYQYLRGAGNGNANAVDAYLASINATGAQGRAPSVEQGMMGRGGVGAAVDAMFGSTRYDNAMSFVAGGGHSRRRELDALRAQRRTPGGQMMGAAAQDRASRAAVGSMERRAGVVEAGLVGDEDALRGLMGGGTFRTLYEQSLASAGNAGSFNESLASLREEALRMEGPQRATAQSLIRQMEDSYRNNNGRLGSEFTTIMQDPRQQEAYRRQIAVTQGNFRVMGAQIGGMQGLEGFGSQLTGIADLYARGGPDAANQINQGMFDFTRNVAHASDADRQRLYEQMGTTDHGRMMMQSIMQYEARDMNLGGRGRRGAMGARESAAELATGGSVGDMEFRVRGQRVRGRQGLEAAARLTGDDLTAARSDYIRQMQEQGVGAEGAGQMFDAYRRASSGVDTENGHRVRFNQSERDELQRLAQSTGIDEAQSRRSMDQARAANPLLAQVSRTLEEIRDRLPSVPERQTEAAKAEAQNRSLVTIAENIVNLSGVPTGEE